MGRGYPDPIEDDYRKGMKRNREKAEQDLWDGVLEDDKEKVDEALKSL